MKCKRETAQFRNAETKPQNVAYFKIPVIFKRELTTPRAKLRIQLRTQRISRHSARFLYQFLETTAMGMQHHREPAPGKLSEAGQHAAFRPASKNLGVRSSSEFADLAAN
jgi:hypothetical protein